jgi:hypothetical protein
MTLNGEAKVGASSLVARVRIGALGEFGRWNALDAAGRRDYMLNAE